MWAKSRLTMHLHTYVVPVSLPGLQNSDLKFKSVIPRRSFLVLLHFHKRELSWVKVPWTEDMSTSDSCRSFQCKGCVSWYHFRKRSGGLRNRWQKWNLPLYWGMIWHQQYKLVNFLTLTHEPFVNSTKAHDCIHSLPERQYGNFASQSIQSSPSLRRAAQELYVTLFNNSNSDSWWKKLSQHNADFKFLSCGILEVWVETGNADICVGQTEIKSDSHPTCQQLPSHVDSWKVGDPWFNDDFKKSRNDDFKKIHG